MHKFTNYFIGIIILLVLSTINVFALEGNVVGFVHESRYNQRSGF